MFHEHQTQVGKLQLNVMRGPASGPPLVFFHGVIRRWQTFLPVLPALAARWEVWGLDFPGHGKSEWSKCEYRVADYIAAASDFVRQQFRTPVALYGHSLGAMVAAGVAAALGDNVLAVVLEDPPFDTMGTRIRQTSLGEYFAKLRPFASDRRPIGEIASDLAEITTTDPRSQVTQRLGNVRDVATLRFMSDCLQRLDPAVLKPIVGERWLEGYAWRDCFARITAPTLLLQADEPAGGMLTDADVLEALTLTQDGTRLKFAGAGHNLHWSRTQEVINVVTAFLEPLRTALM